MWPYAMMMTKIFSLKKTKQGGSVFQDSYDNPCDSPGPPDERPSDLGDAIGNGAFQLLGDTGGPKNWWQGKESSSSALNSDVECHGRSP